MDNTKALVEKYSIQITELQSNCKKFRDEAISLRTKPAVLTHVLRRCMEQIGTGSKLYQDCHKAIKYSQSETCSEVPK